MAGEGFRVLIAEDNPGDALLIREVMADSGMAPSGVEVVERLATLRERIGDATNGSSWDVLLLDLSLPDSRGLETLERVRECAAELPIVVLTGQTDETVALHAVQHGAQDYLSKRDLAPDTLRRVIHYAVDRQRSEGALRRAKEEAEAANRAKNDFLAVISHELRTPLNAIMGMGELLADRPLDDEAHDYLTTQRKAADGLLTLINDLLDLVQTESGRITLHHAPFDIRALISSLEELMRHGATAKGLTLTAHCDPAVPALLDGDEQRLRQVLINLVGNAVKFSERGTIRVDVAPDPEDRRNLRIRVADQGIGIAAEHHQRIFAPFTQADASSTRQYGGSGLGLAIVQRLTAAMGGRVRLESALGHGTTVHLSVPLAAASVAPTQPTPRDPPQPFPPTERPLKILLAEDAEDNIVLIRAFLKQTPHTLEVVTDGRQALEAFRRGGYGLVLMDIQMPTMDGLEATRAIRAWEREQGREPTPILALTAHAMKQDRERSRAAGCDGHLTKPIKKGELIGEVGRYAKGELLKRNGA